MLLSTYLYAYDVAKVISQLEPSFYREELVPRLQERIEKGIKKLSESLSSDKYVQIYKEF